MKDEPPRSFRIWLYIFTFCSFMVAVSLFHRWSDFNWDRIHNLHFHRVNGSLVVFNDRGDVALRGNIGLLAPADWHTMDCSKLHPDADICVEWLTKVRAKIRTQHYGGENVCHNIYWKSFVPNGQFHDCFEMEDARWYGLGDVRGKSWPLNIQDDTFRPFVTSDANSSLLGSVLERYWLSSKGISIVVEADVPLFVRLNTSNSLCLEARNEFPYKLPLNKYAFLNYTICSGPNMRKVHENAVRLLQTKPFILPSKTFIKNPIWSPSHLENFTLTDNATLQGFVADMKQRNIAGLVYVDPKLNGDFQSQVNMTMVASQLHSIGLKVLIPITPYSCHKSKGFITIINDHFLEGNSLPNYFVWNNQLCGMLDLTNRTVASWYVNNLIQANPTVDGFVLKEGFSSLMSHDISYDFREINPDDFLFHYINTSISFGALIGTSVGFRTQHLGGAIFLNPREPTWEGLKSIIPKILSLGITGYPVVSVGPVGGAPPTQDQELYLRWLQLVTFLPMIEIAQPSPNLKLWRKTRQYLGLRENVVIPALLEAAKEYERHGWPLIRPLWWEGPRASCGACGEEFLVGSGLLVAPVLEAGRTQRTVVLPPGLWRDGNAPQRIWNGDQTIPNYPASIEKIPYFVRVHL